jgi:calcium-dependent protein kinase
MSAETSKMIVETFKKFDTNGDGIISKEELTRVLKAIAGNTFDDSSVERLMEASDLNKDGKIQYEEFVAWVTQDLKQEDDALQKQGKKFMVDYRKLLPERFQVGDSNKVTDRYDLVADEIGAGGFGKVFKARDKEFDNRTVAVKKVQKNTRTPTESADLGVEIQVMKDLDHPNICKLLATFEEGRNIFFIMELCEGGEVFDRIIELGYISERTTSEIVGQVASALHYAHFRKICHRDIKPENVVFCSTDKNDNRVKLIDWGLATNFGDSAMVKAVGSMTYAAPEVISSQDRRAYTEACDIWSTGVLTYVMLCGKPPFWGNRDQHYNAAKNERYPFKDPPWDRMNPDAKDFIKRSLKNKVENRIKTEDVVKHAWLVTPPPEGSEKNTESVVSNLKNFCAQSAFSRLCITAVARQLDHNKLKDIHQVFRELDKDGNGVLSADEVKSGLGSLGGGDVDTMFANLDMDGSSSIDYTEFCAAALSQAAATAADVAWAAFKTFDLDNTGFITTDSLKRILDSTDIQDAWSADVCQEVGSELIEKFDQNGDDKISFQEWQSLMDQCWNNKKCVTETNSEPLNAYALLTKVSQLS